ncbi:MAG: FHA domain-containing protein [Chloroflexi bacterium]|nr:FHA domain-containing protein [Chloroflexota bacterium]
MWLLTIRSPFSEPWEYILKPGVTTIGRQKNSNITLTNDMISRSHAEIHFDGVLRKATIIDMRSTNGTFVNHRRITSTEARILRPTDVIRIGPYELQFSKPDPSIQFDKIASTTTVTESMVLEVLDKHAILLHEIIKRLSKVIDIDHALKEISQLMKQSLGVDVVDIVLKHQFNNLSELGFPSTYADRVIQGREAIYLPDLVLDTRLDISISAGRLKIRSLLCVPIILHNQVIGLVYLYTTSSNGRLLSETDLNIAIAVAHLSALTLERVYLIEKNKEQERMHLLLQRLLPVSSADSTLSEYLKSGKLPELSEQTVTVLFLDIINSTRMAEKLGAKRFGYILQRYYQEMTEIIFNHGGLVDKYLGDGVMAVFGMSGDRDGVEKRAVEAGLQILDQIESKFRRNEDPVKIGVAINSGVVMAGYVVTEHRVELSIFGDPVNVAARLQKFARPNRLLIGPSTHEALDDNYKIQNIGSVEIRGRTEPVNIHEVIRESRIDQDFSNSDKLWIMNDRRHQ